MSSGPVGEARVSPAVCRSLPELRVVEQSLKNYRDQYNIFTVHKQGIKTLDEIPAEIRRDWTFPILLDANGRMEREYGVTAIPFYAVIDRRGIVRPITYLHEFDELVKGVK